MREIKVAEPQEALTDLPDPYQITLEVERVWKGDVSAITVVETPQGGCGSTFLAIEHYLVIPDTHDPVKVGHCSGTKPMSALDADDLAMLGSDYAPIAADGIGAHAMSLPRWALWGVGLLLLISVIVALLIVVWRRRVQAG